MGEITGRQVLVFTVGAFGIVIGVNILLAVEATRTFPGLEVENSFVASQEFDADRTAQEALGWSARADYDNGALTIDFRGPDGRPVDVDRIEALVGWATSTRDDFAPDFRREGSTFRAPVDLVAGNWDVFLKAWAPDGTLFQQRLALHVGGVTPPPAPVR
ncbi:MAG: FixH family protein [Rhodobacteraceae bacterium]|nr:FixH family protein [Paracoccaceae bacterium]